MVKKYHIVKSRMFKKKFVDFGNTYIALNAKSANDVWYPSNFPVADLEHFSYLKNIPKKVKQLFKKFKDII